MYGWCNGIIFVNPACTRSWLAIAARAMVTSTNTISSGLRRLKITYETRPTQSRRNCPRSSAASSAALSGWDSVMGSSRARRRRGG